MKKKKGEKKRDFTAKGRREMAQRGLVMKQTYAEKVAAEMKARLEKRAAVLKMRSEKAAKTAKALARIRARKKQEKTDTRLFKPKLTEGKAAVEALLAGKSRQARLSEEELGQAAELVRMLTDDSIMLKYPTWDLRAVALGLSPARLWTIRHSKQFHTMLVEAIRNEAVVGVAAALPNQMEIAKDPIAPNATQAFKNLTDLGGVSAAGKAAAGGGTNVNITFAQQLRQIATETVKTIDVEPRD